MQERIIYRGGVVPVDRKIGQAVTGVVYFSIFFKRKTEVTPPIFIVKDISFVSFT